MRRIQVTYRAVFAQPQGDLNPMGLKLNGPCPVEVFGNGDKWKVRELASPARRVYERLKTWPSAESAQRICEASFTTQLEPWQTWGTPPLSSERMLSPDEITVLADRTYFKETEDYTHILHAPAID